MLFVILRRPAPKPVVEIGLVGPRLGIIEAFGDGGRIFSLPFFFFFCSLFFFSVPLVPWSFGTLVLWSRGPLVPWSFGPVVPWSSCKLD